MRISESLCEPHMVWPRPLAPNKARNATTILSLSEKRFYETGFYSPNLTYPGHVSSSAIFLVSSPN